MPENRAAERGRGLDWFRRFGRRRSKNDDKLTGSSGEIEVVLHYRLRGNNAAQ